MGTTPNLQNAYDQMQRERLLAQANAQSQNSYVPRPDHTDMLRGRLRYSAEGLRAVNFDYLHVHVPPAGEVMIVAVKGEDIVVLRDDRSLFPSDTLVAQLRMIQD